MRRVLVGIGVVVVGATAGCGGTDWAASHATAALPKASTVAITAAERPFVDALVASAKANTAPSSARTPAGSATDRCVASAVVHGYGAPIFVARGLTPAALREPDSTLDRLPAPTPAQVTAVGTSLQRCGIGMDVATEIVTQMKTGTPDSIICLAAHVNQTIAIRRFAVLSVMARPIDLAAARAAVDLIASCFDLPTLILQAGNVHTDPTTHACLIAALAHADDQVRSYLAFVIVGDAPAARTVLTVLVSRIGNCRSPSTPSG